MKVVKPPKCPHHLTAVVPTSKLSSGKRAAASGACFAQVIRSLCFYLPVNLESLYIERGFRKPFELHSRGFDTSASDDTEEYIVQSDGQVTVNLADLAAFTVAVRSRSVFFSCCWQWI